MTGDTQPELRDWIGRTQTEHDELALFPARGMAALLDRAPDEFVRGAPLPVGWHWLYFKPVARQSELGDDGHARRGGLLPPVQLPRRMWAGGQLRVLQPLRLGNAVTRVSTVRDVASKRGRSGELVFVSVQHIVSGGNGPACDERQDIVYREGMRPGEPPPGAELLKQKADWCDEFRTDSVALFRFSALTFNGHRIHYDQRWARDVEGYPDLVVHAPLLALLLLDAASRHGDGRVVSGFEYRALAPLFSGQTVLLQGAAIDRTQTQVWATSPAGGIALGGVVEWGA